MAAPVADKIQLPDDSGNTGKKVRSQTRVVGSNTVHEHFFIQVRQAAVLGVYAAALAQQTVLQNAQDGTTTAFLWAHVPSAVTNKKVRLRRVYFQAQHSTALATPTAPRLNLTRITFTGTASGAAVTPCKLDTTYPTAVFDLRTAVTGLTPALVAVLGAGALAGAITAVGAYNPCEVNLVDGWLGEDNWPVLAPGEGVVLYQDTAGTASDTRKFNPILVWDEIDTA